MEVDPVSTGHSMAGTDGYYISCMELWWHRVAVVIDGALVQWIEVGFNYGVLRNHM